MPANAFNENAHPASVQFLFFSWQQAEKSGALVASIPDLQNGGKREIIYTHMTAHPGHGALPGDATMIWSGKPSDIEFVREMPAAELPSKEATTGPKAKPPRL